MAVRVMGGALVLAALVLSAPSAAAGGHDGPGSNDLRLAVERLERAGEADVKGSEASAMLFDPADSQALAAAARAAEESRAATAGSLFVGHRAPWRVPVTTEALFAFTVPDAGSASGAEGPAVEVSDEAEDAVPGGAIGLGGLLAAGLAASYVMRERQVDQHG